MNNYSITTADRSTHLKVVVVALIASIVVIALGIATRSNLPDMSTQLEARGPALKAGQTVIWTNSDQVSIR